MVSRALQRGRRGGHGVHFPAWWPCTGVEADVGVICVDANGVGDAQLFYHLAQSHDGARSGCGGCKG
eukprot:3820740-Prorocentrum_lima.AAC.1